MNAATSAAVEPAFGKAGAWLSLTCAVHCMIEPMILPLLPLAGTALPLSRAVELSLTGASVLLALWNFSRGFLFHGNGRLFGILAVALLFIGAGFLADFLPDAGHAWETILIVIGTLLLATGQFWNRHLHRNCIDCRDARRCEA
jgi:hypothetical protein